MKWILALVFLANISIGHGQSDKYWVYLAPSIDNHQLDAPALSQKALDRRAKQGIELSANDYPIHQDILDDFQTVPGVQILHASRWMSAIAVEADLQGIAVLQADSRVQQIKKTKAQRVKFEEPVQEKSAGLTDFFTVEYGDAFRQIEVHNGQFLHQRGYKGKGITIAVIDAGFDMADSHAVLTHLFDNNQILGTKDFVEGDTYLYNSHSHGTSVLSCMGAKLDGVMQGTAPDASYWLLRSENGDVEVLLEEYHWVAAAEFADSVGADIINTSLGYTEFDDPSENHVYADLDGNTTVITRGAEIAASKGILMVTSAGNMGAKPWYYISAPADADSTLAVGAVNRNLIVPAFSSRGPSADGDVKPNVSAVGSYVTVAKVDGSTGTSHGTSFSSPVMAGMAACLWQAFPGKTNMEIKSMIEKAGHQYDNPDVHQGYGIPDFYKAYKDELSIGQVESSDRFVGVYPSPCNDFCNVEFYNHVAGEWTLSVVNEDGRIVYTRTEDVEAETYVLTTLQQELVHLNSGVFVISLKKTGGHNFTKRVVKY